MPWFAVGSSQCWMAVLGMNWTLIVEQPIELCWNILQTCGNVICTIVLGEERISPSGDRHCLKSGLRSELNLKLACYGLVSCSLWLVKFFFDTLNTDQYLRSYIIDIVDKTMRRLVKCQVSEILFFWRYSLREGCLQLWKINQTPLSRGKPRVLYAALLYLGR